MVRCGHVKLGDLGSSVRLSEGGAGVGAGAAPATADYMAPELLAAADCATHTVCVAYCARLVTTAIVGCSHTHALTHTPWPIMHCVVSLKNAFMSDLIQC